MNITYCAKINFEIENKFKLSNIPFDNIRDISIYSTSKNEMEFLFETNYTDEKQAEFDTSLMMKHFEKIFWFKENKALTDIRIKSIRSTDGNTVNLGVSDILTIFETVSISTKMDSLEEYRELFDNYGSFDREYLDLYFSISKLKDLSGKYVMYYSILSSIIGSQKLIDKHIRNEIANVEEKPTSRSNANYNETIFTYIRNQIGHTEDNTNINQLYFNIQNNLSTLREIVYKVIMNNN